MSSLEEFCDEIILKILSFVSIKDLVICQQVSKKLQKLANDKTLWKRIKMQDQQIPKELMELMVKNGVQYLDLTLCRVPEISQEFLLKHQFDLKHLDLKGEDYVSVL